MLCFAVQFTAVMGVLWCMLEQVDRQRRSKMINEGADFATVNAAIRYIITTNMNKYI